jgi:hypothetical protein
VLADSSGSPMSAGDVTLSTDAMGNTTQHEYTASNQTWCQVAPAEYLDGARCPAQEPTSEGSLGPLKMAQAAARIRRLYCSTAVRARPQSPAPEPRQRLPGQTLPGRPRGHLCRAGPTAQTRVPQRAHCPGRSRSDP